VYFIVRGYQNIKTEICCGEKWKYISFILTVNGKADFGGKVNHPKIVTAHQTKTTVVYDYL